MKKLNKILTIFMLVVAVCTFTMPVLATKDKTNSGNVSFDIGFTSEGSAGETLNGLFGNVWSAIQTIANFVALVMVVVAGIRYMFASADQKADIKKQTVILIVGAIFIFAAGNIVKLIASAAQAITNQTA